MPQPAASAGTEQPPGGEQGLPDWLGGSSTGPAAGAEQGQPPAAPSGDESTPDWLKGLSGAAEPGADAAPQEAPAGPAGEEGTPDWLKGLGGGLAAETPGGPPEGQPAVPAGDESVPDWLKGLSESPVESPPPAAPEQAPAAPPPAGLTPEPAGTLEDTKPRPVEAPLGEEETFRPTGEAKPLDIGDDALAWLEGLAAKQGAKAEELLTKPEERSEETPDWLRQAGEQGTGAAAGQPPAASAEQSVESPPSAAEAAPVPAEEPAQADTLAWLKGLSEAEGGQPAGSAPAEEETPGVPPDLFERVFENHKPVPPPDSGPLPKLESAEEEEDITVTGWLKSLASDGGPTSAPPSAEQPAASSQEDMPDWLKDLNSPAPGAQSAEPPPASPPPAEAPGAGIASEAASEPASATELPEWLRGTLEPAPPDAQPQAPAEFAPTEDERPAWLDASTPVSDAATPTTPEEWVPAESAPPEPQRAPQAAPPPATPEPKPASLPARPAPTQPPAPEGGGQLSRVPAEDKDAELLQLAQAGLAGNRLSEAMQNYAKLIKKGRLLDEVIHDLREAIYRFPVDVIVWQTLGDAYMRASRLQEALDAYTKAEELLR
jgi:hypothetical protein